MTQAIYFSHRITPPGSFVALNGRNIPFVNNVKYLGVIFDKKITWRSHIKTIEAKAFRAFIRTYSLFKSKRLSTNIKLTLHKALVRSIMTCLSRLGIRGRYPSVKIATPAKEGSPHHWQFSKAHSGLQIA
jgi:hypothetical protein